jgi:hypothetical protein
VDRKGDCNATKLCDVAAWLPIAITVVGFALYWIQARTTDAIIVYLDIIEIKLSQDGGFGLFFSRRKAGRFLSTRNVMTSIYGLQFVGSVAFAVFFVLIK